MSKVTSVKFGNGSIAYRSKIEPVPASSVTNGNVTTNNSGAPGRPAHFDVSFMLSVAMENDGVEFTNVFHWNDVVPSHEDGSPYREVEDAAARNLAPALRAAADLIEAEIARYEERVKDREKSPE